ncbi:hypothetical protein [Fangia hongkongensis]|uniref:hypothetical protein n=1 Tax=Fangia hongkongensis TaxID=270495 RepID=UPI00038042B0|nr:hypothetical protein [Fangia hongkongensis]MBK2124321.1 hypothetical protein [Fangia hongkongensis]
MPLTIPLKTPCREPSDQSLNEFIAINRLENFPQMLRVNRNSNNEDQAVILHFSNRSKSRTYGDGVTPVGEGLQLAMCVTQQEIVTREIQPALIPKNLYDPQYAGSKIDLDLHTCEGLTKWTEKMCQIQRNRPPRLDIDQTKAFHALAFYAEILRFNLGLLEVIAYQHNPYEELYKDIMENVAQCLTTLRINWAKTSGITYDNMVEKRGHDIRGQFLSHRNRFSNIIRNREITYTDILTLLTDTPIDYGVNASDRAYWIHWDDPDLLYDTRHVFKITIYSHIFSFTPTIVFRFSGNQVVENDKDDIRALLKALNYHCKLKYKLQKGRIGEQSRLIDHGIVCRKSNYVRKSKDENNYFQLPINLVRFDQETTVNAEQRVPPCRYMKGLGVGGQF